MLRVKETLPHHGDRPHERTGIGTLVLLVRLEGDVLKDVRLHDDFIWILLGQGDKRAAATDDAPGRSNGRRGEAQFAVAHDASRPFEVSAARRIVRAVGTAFDVRLDPDLAMQVLVTEGRVAVEDASGITSVDAPPVATVSAGENAVAHEGRVSVHRVSSAEQSRRLAWQVGELLFQGETLREAVAEFNRYNRRKLKVGDPAIAGREIGGIFQATDVDSFVAALQRSFDVTATTSDDGTVVLKRSGGSVTKFAEP